MSEILTQNLGMKCVLAKFIPWLLLPEQQEHRAAVASDLIQTTTNEPDVLKKVITRDESWFYGCGPETKVQLSQRNLPGSPHPKKAWQSRHKMKTMLTVLFDLEGIVHHKHTPLGQIVNKEYYLNILQHLTDAL